MNKVTYATRTKFKALIVEALTIVCLVSCSRVASKSLSPITPIRTNLSAPSINSESTKVKTSPPSILEHQVKIIPLSSDIAESKTEISGMAWFGEYLILLPQYPSISGTIKNGAIFAVSKEDIKSYIDGVSTQPLQPIMIPFYANNVEELIAGFEGFEAIAFHGNQAFLTIEASPKGMMGYIVSGRMESNLSGLYLITNNMQEIPPQTEISNMSEESLMVFGNRLISLYEANGANINQSPQAHTFDLGLQPRELLPFPNIEYRITDVTSPDDFGRFWAINYFYPGDHKLYPAEDKIASQYGEGSTHHQYTTVERLVEFQFSYEGIILINKPPIQLQLIDDQNARNWEAIARLDDRGFLLATDSFPETLFAFVSTTRP